MTLNDYQIAAKRTSRRDITQSEHLLNGILGLSGEAGECADLVKKRIFQDGREIGAKLLDELGDVLWYVAETASAMGWRLDDVAEHNRQKLLVRYPEGFSAERSLHRKEEGP